MRAVVALVSLTLTGLLAACMSDPHLELFDDSVESTLPTAASPEAGRRPGSEPSDDAGADGGTIPTPADASVPEPPPPEPPPTNPPPPGAVCPPAGAPAGTLCCGANGAAPPCFGLACEHCGDCVAKGCPTGQLCCADSPGGSGKYKGMTCRLDALAGSCPK